MRKTLFALLILVMSATVGFAQRGAEVDASIHAVVNQTSANANNLGLGIGIRYRFNGIVAGGEGVGSDNNPARARYFVAYGREWRGVDVEGGGGFFRFGQQDGGFAHLGARKDQYSGYARAGSMEFVEVDGAYRIWEHDNFSLHPYFRFTHHDVNRRNTNLFMVGIRFTFSDVN